MSDGRDFLPPDVKALVDAERHRFVIPDGARDRLLSKLASGASALGHGAGPSVPPAGAAPLASSSSTLLGATAAKVILALSVVGAATAFVLVRSPSWTPTVGIAAPALPPSVLVEPAERPSSPSPQIAAVPVATPLPSEPARPRPIAPTRDVARAPIAPASARPGEETQAETASLAEERRLLDAARASIVGGDPEAALPTLESCAARFPGGPLTEERLALQIRALARTGHRDDARAVLETLRADYPHSFVLQGAIDDVARIP